MRREFKLITVVVWVLLLIIYIHYSIRITQIYDESKHAYPQYYNETWDYLIDTPGCKINNYGKTLKFTEGQLFQETCGERAVFVEKRGVDEIAFIIDATKFTTLRKANKILECCYRFARRSDVDGKENNELIYTPCKPIQNTTTIKLEEEVITVTCKNKEQKTIYEDTYVVLKKLPEKGKIIHNNAWNVLFIGLDTMSRARAIHSLPRTVQYFKENHWLDYRGYQKVASNTFPNLMALLAGINSTVAYGKCQRNMEACNEIMMWSKFRKAGYVTAYGEDYLRLPDTFSKFEGFKTLPTDHYMRPFFLTGEKEKGNFICASKKTSVSNILYYASEFATTYKDEGFFGLFWINSCSHNLNNRPRSFDSEFLSFFDNINETGALENTFLLYASDHGIRFGKTREAKESFFEERLPMLFIWVPLRFRQHYSKLYRNLKLNQGRLVTPYDIYLTLSNILQMSMNNIDVVRSEGCLNCSSIFEEISSSRKCQDANIGEKWCTCHGTMVDSMHNDTSGSQSLKMAVKYIQDKTKRVETMPCTVCSPFKLNKVLRNQWYRNEFNNATYYVIAFSMSPGEVAYEVTVEKYDGQYTVLGPSDPITSYNVKGNCVKNPNDRAYCVCKNVKC